MDDLTTTAVVTQSDWTHGPDRVRRDRRVAMSGALMASPVIWAALGEPSVSFGDPVDSLGAYLVLSAGGLVALYCLGWAMVGLGRARV
jgi:hypothetical protein